MCDKRRLMLAMGRNGDSNQDEDLERSKNSSHRLACTITIEMKVQALSGHFGTMLAVLRIQPNRWLVWLGWTAAKWVGS